MKNAVVAVLALILLSSCGFMPKAPVIELGSPIVPPPGTKLKTIAIGKMVVRIPRNTVYGSVHWDLLCQMKEGDLRWTSGSSPINGGDLQNVLKDELVDAGFEVAYDPTAVFQQVHLGADVILAAEIVSLEHRICIPYRDLGKPKDYKGWAMVSVRWRVKTCLHDKVVLDLTTDGLYELHDAVSGGHQMVLQEAFAAAARNLMADKRFYSLASGEMDKALMAKAEADRKKYKAISLPKAKLFTEPLAGNTSRILPAVVVIFDATGHGSGFMVSPDGYILTNAHVVKTAKFVNVRLRSGREVMGEVLRKDDVRDVALVKIGEDGMHYLPILRDKERPVGSEIHAIGAPLDTALSYSVTKGVLSAYRTHGDGLKYIQSDVNIQCGNSGGPLVDQSGNVIGISVLGRIDPATGTSVGINFFIPIKEAMTALELK